MAAEALLRELEQLGVRLSLSGQELRIQAPKGLISAELQARIKAAKPELILLLSTVPVGAGSEPVHMKFSLFFFGTESSAGPEPYALLLAAAELADELGFTGIWTPERHFHDLGGHFPNPAVLAAALAMRTRRLKLRAGSVVLPLQDPIRVAEDWAVVDQLSQGRVELSFASGWHANDFALAPDNYSQRFEVLYNRLAEVRSLWRGDSLARVSGSGESLAVRSFPRPQQAELPVWLTAIGNPESYRRIGAQGAHLLTALLDQSLSELSAKLPIYHQALAAAGHTPRDFQTAVFMHSFVGDRDENIKELVREPFKRYLSQTLNLLGQLSRSLGIDLDPDSFSAEDTDALLDYTFERYYDERSLMGSPERCLKRVRELQQAGVHEIACLVDFGLDHDTVLRGIRNLGELIQQTSQTNQTRQDRAHG